MTTSSSAVPLPARVFALIGWVAAVVGGIGALGLRIADPAPVLPSTFGIGDLLTGVLAAVFAGLILLLQGLLAPFTQGQTIAVAFSTLVVFALFQPVCRRVQDGVDRRFDRARFDADRTIESFSDRLRANVDLATVSQEIARTADAAVRPRSVSVWLRGAPR